MKVALKYLIRLGFNFLKNVLPGPAAFRGRE